MASLFDTNIIRLQNDVVSVEGVLKLISNYESSSPSHYNVVDSVSRLSHKYHDPTLCSLHWVFTEFANSGFDLHTWTLTSSKEIEAKQRKLELCILEELSVLETGLLLYYNNWNEKIEACSPKKSQFCGIF